MAHATSFLSGITQTLADPVRTKELIDTITETDPESGQSYLKIPVESKEVVQNALKLLGALFGK